jgi:transposase
MRHIGLDVHQRDTKLCWIDEAAGEVSNRATVPTREVVAAVSALPGERCVVLETGSQSWFLARALQTLPQTQVFVVDAFQARRSLEGMHRGKKTDQWDALGLAKLSLQGRAAAMAVWLADLPTQQLRVLVRTRAAPVQQTTALQNQLRALLRAEGLQVPGSDLMGRQAQQDLDVLLPVLPPVSAMCGAQLRRSLHHGKQQLQELEGQLTTLARAHPDCRRLMTLPGCGVILAATIVAEIGSIGRFREAKHLRSYAGLTPAVCQSGERSHRGPLTRGHRGLKYALVLLAQHFAWHRGFADTGLKQAYYRCLHRHGPTPAKVALARHLCAVIFAMLRDGTDFAPQQRVA